MSIDVMEPDLKTHGHEVEPLAASGPLSPDLLRRMNAYWRAANYLSARYISTTIRC
jgi:xylulose-5-phosphate/fructose-6-phosphate phosphoketolase